MKLVDTNVLLYAVNESAPKHKGARRWLDGALSGQEAIAFAWIALLAFLRLSTKPGLFPNPLPVDDALTIVEGWIARPPSLVIEPTGRHLAVLSGLLREAGTAGNLVSDAHLAALAIEHGATIVSYDRDFVRFSGLQFQLPEA